MHLSHLTEDLEAWYLNFDFAERVLTAFRPGMTQVRDGDADGGAGPGGRLVRPRAQAPVRENGSLRPQRVDPGGVAAAAGHRRRRRNRLPEGNRDSAARRLQHARQSVRVDRRSEARPAGATPRSPACISSSSIRRATTSSATGSRWTVCCPTARSCRCLPARGRRASTRSSRRPIARTSSCRRAGTARSRSPSCDAVGSRRLTTRPSGVPVETHRPGRDTGALLGRRNSFRRQTDRVGTRRREIA